MAPSMKKIVESAMPGWQLQEDANTALDAAKADAAPPDQVGKSDAELKRKYLKSRAPGGKATTTPAQAEATEGKLKFGRVVEKQPKDAAVGSKTVLVDPVSGKVKAVQG
jgi:hypothetical protein